MGSVIDYLDCPKCGNEAYNEFYYKSGEEFIFCNSCGYSRKFFIDNWEDREKKKDDALFEWLPNFKLEETDGFGCYKIRPKGSVGMEVGTFTQPNSAEEFLNSIKGREAEIAHAEYSTFIDGEITKHVVIQGELEAEADKTDKTVEVEGVYYDDEIEEVRHLFTDKDNLPDTN